MLSIDFLYYEDCPSHDKALARLRDVLAAEGVNAEIDVTKVETQRQADDLRFIGSPTIRIDGEDIDPPPDNARYALTCRAYRREDGRVTPLPTEDLIRRALRKHAPQDG